MDEHDAPLDALDYIKMARGGGELTATWLERTEETLIEERKKLEEVTKDLAKARVELERVRALLPEWRRLLFNSGEGRAPIGLAFAIEKLEAALQACAKSKE